MCRTLFEIYHRFCELPGGGIFIFESLRHAYAYACATMMRLPAKGGLQWCGVEVEVEVLAILERPQDRDRGCG